MALPDNPKLRPLRPFAPSPRSLDSPLRDLMPLRYEYFPQVVGACNPREPWRHEGVRSRPVPRAAPLNGVSMRRRRPLLSTAADPCSASAANFGPAYRCPLSQPGGSNVCAPSHRCFPVRVAGGGDPRGSAGSRHSETAARRETAARPRGHASTDVEQWAAIRTSNRIGAPLAAVRLDPATTESASEVWCLRRGLVRCTCRQPTSAREVSRSKRQAVHRAPPSVACRREPDLECRISRRG